jgi:hypothetical protein
MLLLGCRANTHDCLYIKLSVLCNKRAPLNRAPLSSVHYGCKACGRARGNGALSTAKIVRPRIPCTRRRSCL